MIILKSMSEVKVKVTGKWYMTLCYPKMHPHTKFGIPNPKMHPHTKFGIPNSKNIRDILRTQ